MEREVGTGSRKRIAATNNKPITKNNTTVNRSNRQPARKLPEREKIRRAPDGEGGAAVLDSTELFTSFMESRRSLPGSIARLELSAA